MRNNKFDDVDKTTAFPITKKMVRGKTEFFEFTRRFVCPFRENRRACRPETLSR